MDVRLFRHSAARLSPDLLAEVKYRMGNRGGDCGGSQTVADRKGCGDKQGTVCLIRLLIERSIGIDDPRHVVWMARVVISGGGRDG